MEEGWNRPPVMEPDGEAELLEVAMGPHHPSTHGVFRMDVALDGERVIRLKPVFGYLHRNHEKIAEGASYLASMPYTDRLDYFCSLTNNWAYALAVEKLTGQAVPERAEHIRVILAELTRIQNHASAIGFLIQEMGASGTPLMYAFKEREKILDLFESLTGSRMMCNYMRFGGCRVDVSAAWLDAARNVVAGLPNFIDEFENLLSGQRDPDGALVRAWASCARISPSTPASPAPCFAARASTTTFAKWTTTASTTASNSACRWAITGDVYDRYMVRVLEMRESIAILNQALKEIPGGPVMDPKAKIRGFRPKPGEAYGRIEAPKGELGFYLISDGGRTHIATGCARQA